MSDDSSTVVPLIPIGLFAFSALSFWIMYKTGDLETSKQYKARKQREADEFAEMSPEIQQLHIHAKNKVTEFKFSLVVFLVTTIASGYLIYLCIK